MYNWKPAPHELLDWLKIESVTIIQEWVDKLSTLSPSYRRRKREELMGTVSEAFEAYVEYISYGRLDRIQRFIDHITEKRLLTGFPLSDVQKAFELFRLVALNRLVVQKGFSLLARSLEPINACLSYTIHKFSDHYQHMHELSIRKHAKNLEHEISVRTAELAASKRRYQTLVEGINDGYFVIQDHRIIFANSAFCSMHRAELKDILGKPFAWFVDEESRKSLLEGYQEILSGGAGPGPIQYILAGEPRESAYREVRARLADLGDGPVIIGICRDISERVSMEARVRENERMAYVGHLSASLSHEIRNPLSSIKMNLQILERKLQLNGYDRRRLEITVHEVSRLEEILCQLLDTARPMTITKSPANLVKIAQSCVNLLEPKVQEKKLKIVKLYPRRIRPIKLDITKVEQALINLLLNAIEASPEGGTITVWIKNRRTGGDHFVELGVRDTGVGITPEQLNTLFTPFNTSKSQGSGLGLSNVKRIVEAHSGSVKVGNQDGPGATFLIRLPFL
ncbi:MAG: two-component system sensor histidine kinase NtrB [Desulfomonilaceae bacterium]